MVFFTALAVPAIKACSIGYAPIGGFDPDTHTFIGKVIGFKSEVLSPKQRWPMAGLEIEVLQSVDASRNGDKIVVAPSFLLADCGMGGSDLSKLMEDFPLNSSVKVIGRPLKTTASFPSVILVLEAGYSIYTMISINPPAGSLFHSTIDLEFGYDRVSDTDVKGDRNKFEFISFEIRKDLFRLDKSRSLTERKRTLNRLRLAPKHARLNFELVESTYGTARPTDQ